ncbi:ferrochelatase [Tropicibacter sp. S64]|uniref:ferrochelatase n=1 Tax=Tropicibacter sp. S64 TaxID=3415122 RepID=UPI003C799AD7
MMRILIAGVIAGALASDAYADSAKPAMTKDALLSDLIVSTRQQQSSSAPGILVPLMLLVVIAAAVSSGSGGSDRLFYD